MMASVAPTPPVIGTPTLSSSLSAIKLLNEVSSKLSVEHVESSSATPSVAPTPAPVDVGDKFQHLVIQARCQVSNLYGAFLMTQPASKTIMCAAHEWSLRHIETLVEDLLVNIPEGKRLLNTTSSSFVLDSKATHTLHALKAQLSDLRHYTTMLELHAKGVL